MKSARGLQITAALLTVALGTFLFLNGRSSSTALSPEGPHSNAGAGMAGQQGTFDFEHFIQDTRQTLTPAGAMAAADLEKSAAQSDTAALGTLARIYAGEQKPAAAGYYYHKLADLQPNNENYWDAAGQNFFQAQPLAQDSLTYHYFLALSTESFGKALALNPSNLSAKAKLAVMMIESDESQTMQGVGMLREVIAAEPDHREALLYLGILSMRSGQWDKAIERFKRLTELDPSIPENYRHLGEAYQGKGDRQAALKAYTDYASHSSSPQLKADAQQLITSLGG